MTSGVERAHTQDAARRVLRRWCSTREDALAAVLLALVVVGYLWPALMGGQTLSPAALLYNGAPWKTARPPDVSSYLNSSLSDVPTQFYPWLSFARDAIRSGRQPTWNPYVGGGTPFYANAQTAMFSPFNLPLWLLPLSKGLAVATALRLWVAAYGTYLWLRQLRLGFWPAAVGGVCFAFGSFNTVWLSHPHVNVSVMLPVMLWLTERLLQQGRGIDGMLLACAVAIAFVGGHPGTEVHVGVAIAIYASVRLIAIDRPARVRRLALFAGAVALGVVIDAAVLLPSAMLVDTGSSVSARVGGGITIPFSGARTLLFPDWWGRPDGFSSRGPAGYNERTLYAGVVALVLATAAVLRLRMPRGQPALVALVVVGLAVPLGAPGIHWLVVHLPALDTVQDARMLLLANLGIAGLLGFGLQALRTDRGRERSRVIGSAVVVAVAGCIGALNLHPSLHEIRITVNHFRTGTDYPVPRIVALTSIGWVLVLVGALVALVLVARRGRRGWLGWLGWLGPAVLLLVVVDAFHFAGRFQPVGPADRVVPSRPPVVAFLQQHGSQMRTVGVQNALWNDFQMTYRLAGARGGLSVNVTQQAERAVG